MVFGKARETPGVGSVADFAVAAAADLTGKSLLLSAGPLLSSFATAGTGVSKIELHFLSPLRRTVSILEHHFILAARLEPDWAKSTVL